MIHSPPKSLSNHHPLPNLGDFVSSNCFLIGPGPRPCSQNKVAPLLNLPAAPLSTSGTWGETASEMDGLESQIRKGYLFLQRPYRGTARKSTPPYLPTYSLGAEKKISLYILHCIPETPSGTFQSSSSNNLFRKFPL